MVRRKESRFAISAAVTRAEKKQEKARDQEKWLGFCKDNPTPKLHKTKRLRMRGSLQMAECADHEMLRLCFPKIADMVTGEHFVQAKAGILAAFGWRIEQRAGRPFIRTLPPVNGVPVHTCRKGGSR